MVVTMWTIKWDYHEDCDSTPYLVRLFNGIISVEWVNTWKLNEEAYIKTEINIFFN